MEVNTTIEGLSELRDRDVWVSVSGGKDSTATCLALREAGVEFSALHADTGWEHAETRRYLAEELPGYIGPITTVSYDGPQSDLSHSPELEALAVHFEARLGVKRSPMIRLILHKAAFPSRLSRYCTQLLKLEPFRDFYAGLEDEPVGVVGVRADESAYRSKLPAWEESSNMGVETWRPIIRWTFDDVIAIHRRHGVIPNQDYLAGAQRVGCWPCIHANKAEIRRMAKADPDRIGLLRDLEAAMLPIWRARRQRGGHDDDPADRPTWFYRARKPGDPLGAPIDEVVEWSNTARGGHQMLLLNTERPGCMRWGLCEANK